jgi:hypothetical protein
VSSWWQFGRRPSLFVTPEKVVRNNKRLPLTASGSQSDAPHAGFATKCQATERTSYAPRPEPSGPVPDDLWS